MLQVQTKNLETVAVVRLEGQLVSGQTEVLRSAAYSLSEAQSHVSAIKLDLARVWRTVLLPLPAITEMCCLLL